MRIKHTFRMSPELIGAASSQSICIMDGAVWIDIPRSNVYLKILVFTGRLRSQPAIDPSQTTLGRVIWTDLVSATNLYTA